MPDYEDLIKHLGFQKIDAKNKSGCKSDVNPDVNSDVNSKSRCTTGEKLKSVFEPFFVNQAFITNKVIINSFDLFRPFLKGIVQIPKAARCTFLYGP